MKLKNRWIDHIVYGVHDLKEAMQWFYEISGVHPVVGGKHIHEGTKNALVNLGNRCYLELLAIDHENTIAKGPRWMGMDDLKTEQVIRWALKTDDINKDIRRLDYLDSNLFQSIEGERLTNDGFKLKWKMTRPHFYPEVELAPFITDWSQSERHPVDSMEEECILKNIEFHHNEVKKYNDLFFELFDENMIVEKKEVAIKISIETPKGLISI